MRAYYGATEGGSNLTAYLGRMLSLFQVLEPAISVSAQRLSDQVRVIQRNHMLDDTVLDRLRLDPRSDPVPPASPMIAVQQQNVPSALPRSDRGGEEDDEVISVSSQCNVQLRSALEVAFREYRSTPPELRPRLHRLPMHNKNKALMCALDSQLSNCYDSSKDLYCGAVAACRVARRRLITQQRQSYTTKISCSSLAVQN